MIDDQPSTQVINQVGMAFVHLFGTAQMINEPPSPFTLVLFVALVEMVNLAQACEKATWQRLFATDCLKQSLMPLIDSVELLPKSSASCRKLSTSFSFRNAFALSSALASIVSQLVKRVFFMLNRDAPRKCDMLAANKCTKFIPNLPGDLGCGTPPTDEKEVIAARVD